VGYHSTLLIVIVVFGILFSLLYVASAVPDRPKVAIVIIPEGSSLPTSEHNNFEPAVITVVIGVNNTVRWINQDVVGSKISADDKSDPAFWNITENAPLLSPGETFEFTFTKLGAYGYHSEPHPHKHGTVMVWLQNPILLPTGIESRPNLTEDDAANITKADMEKKLAPMHVDKFVLYPRYYGHPLTLTFVHENGTQYFPSTGKTCMRTLDDIMSCGMSNELADAIEGHLAYIVDGSWQDASVGNCNHFIYAVDARTGEILWSYIDREEIGSCPVQPPGW
jgi:plastocyanin